MMTAKRCLTPRVRNDNRIEENLKVSTLGENGNRKYIKFEIRIKDSGVGIAKENLSKLFLNFSRLEDHQKCNERGTGLGLSICKSLLEKMGGTITVESDGLGTGSTFIMQL
jgi:signal transduction histidine kinase